MIDAGLLHKELKKRGFDYFIGVPCSYLKSLINAAISSSYYISSVNEGEAVAIASGMSLGKKKAVVLMQNSGLTNAISPLSSLNFVFKIPVLGFVSLRGEDGNLDEPQHELVGRITQNFLAELDIESDFLSGEFSEAVKQLEAVEDYMKINKSFFFIVKKATFLDHPLAQPKTNFNNNFIKICRNKQDQLPTRWQALACINALKDKKGVLLATTGKTGRELYEIEDANNNMYMVGSMGYVNALGLGLSIVKPEREIIVIDGDGALLMHMGNMTTIGSFGPNNLLHILLDNACYDSTGGQSSHSENVNFVDIAAASGYNCAFYAHNLTELETFIRAWQQNKKLTFIHLRIAKGSKAQLGRPKLKPYQVKERLQVFLND